MLWCVVTFKVFHNGLCYRHPSIGYCKLGCNQLSLLLFGWLYLYGVYYASDLKVVSDILLVLSNTMWVILSFFIRLNEYINYWLVAIRPKDENSHSEKLRQKETYTFNFQSRVVFWTRPIREMLKVWNVLVNQKKHLLVILNMMIMMVIIRLIHRFQFGTPDWSTPVSYTHLTLPTIYSV